MTFSEFEETISPLYRQFGWRMGDEEKAQHILDRYGILGKFPLDALGRAVGQLLASETKMPTIAVIRQAITDHLRANRRLLPEPEVDGNHCACGCGGERWSYVLLNPDGTARIYPDNIEELGLPMLAAIPDSSQAAGAILALAGRVMTRDIVDCRRSGTTNEKKLWPIVRTDERGVNIHSPIRKQSATATLAQQRLPAPLAPPQRAAE